MGKELNMNKYIATDILNQVRNRNLKSLFAGNKRISVSPTKSVSYEYYDKSGKGKMCYEVKFTIYNIPKHMVDRIATYFHKHEDKHLRIRKEYEKNVWAGRKIQHENIVISIPYEIEKPKSRKIPENPNFRTVNTAPAKRDYFAYITTQNGTMKMGPFVSKEEAESAAVEKRNELNIPAVYKIR